MESQMSEGLRVDKITMSQEMGLRFEKFEKVEEFVRGRDVGSVSSLTCACCRRRRPAHTSPQVLSGPPASSLTSLSVASAEWLSQGREKQSEREIEIEGPRPGRPRGRPVRKTRECAVCSNASFHQVLHGRGFPLWCWRTIRMEIVIPPSKQAFYDTDRAKTEKPVRWRGRSGSAMQ